MDAHEIPPYFPYAPFLLPVPPLFFSGSLQCKTQYHRFPNSFQPMMPVRAKK